nr:hypothetical protein [Paracoccus saliphilus]
MACTTYVLPTDARATLRLLIHPRRMMRAMRYVRSLNRTSTKDRGKLIALIPSAAALVLDARHNEVSHLHIHSCANAAHLGSLAQIMGIWSMAPTMQPRRRALLVAATRLLAQQIATVSPRTAALVIRMGVD